MGDSKEILKTKFIEHFLFDYTDKDEYEVRMLSEIFENIYYAKGLSFKPKGKYWQVLRCLQNQQDIIDEHTEVIKLQDTDLRKYEKQIENLKEQLNNMEQCYIEKKKEVDELQARANKALSVTGNYCDEDDAALLVFVLEKALRGES